MILRLQEIERRLMELSARVSKLAQAQTQAAQSVGSLWNLTWDNSGGASGALIRAKVTTAIPTGTITTPSNTGRVTLYSWDAGSSTSTAGATGQVVLNDFTISASVPVNTIVKVASIDGALWLVSCECF